MAETKWGAVSRGENQLVKAKFIIQHFTIPPHSLEVFPLNSCLDILPFLLEMAGAARMQGSTLDVN
jgi:hypothetical protein